MRAKAKKTPMCSVRLLALELKGLAAPGEALKYFLQDPARQQRNLVHIFAALGSTWAPAGSQIWLVWKVG